MQKVLTAAQMREVDRLTTERYGIPSIILMENAAHAVARVITEKLGGSVKGKSILILCGKGNNGGDGAAVGRILQLAGADVEIVLFADLDDTLGDARINFSTAREVVGIFREVPNLGLWTSWFESSTKDWDVVVDAIFGSGLSRPIDGWLETVFRTIQVENSTARQFDGRLVIAVDLPSGVIPDTATGGEVLESDVTVTFTAPKHGNVLPDTYRLGGELVVSDIGTSYELIDEVDSQLFAATELDAALWLSRSDFTFDSYKNKRGHALVIAGSETYSGAAVLVGNSAIRSGVGLVTLACPAEAKEEIASRILPEVILATIGSPEFGELAPKANAIAVGPGLSATDPETESLVRKIVTERTTPVIVDAGALWFLSPMQKPARSKGMPPLILTPHEGEFMRLLGTDDKEAIKDRVASVREFSQANNVILVLKGERVLIGHPDGRVVVNPTGNSGLGKAGNGDTLTGVLAGFCAQAAAMDIDIFETVVAAVYIAGLAGDIAERKYGKRVMTASDVRECLSEAFSTIEGGD
jgi:hydroxyethylthiazole kinase-like uncharacterized protein yjeF